MTRFQNRAADSLRPVKITPNFVAAPEGAVLIECGQTRVLCCASVEKSLPAWLIAKNNAKNKNQGWITAEYAMLPRATNKRTPREAVAGKQSGRSQEIQRLIGRSLRAAFDLNKMPGIQILLDCDVLQADGGTRCASICGAFVAAQLAIQKLLKSGEIAEPPARGTLSAVSVGIVKGEPLLDLDYAEDSACDTDMNVVMLSDKIVEIQGTAEGVPFSRAELNALLTLAEQGNAELQKILFSTVNAK